MFEWNSFYNQDCLEAMKQMPDNFADLAIVDPPYGVGSITYMPHKRTKAIGGHLDEYNIVVAVLDMNQRSNVKSKYLVDICHRQNGDKTIKNFGDENVAPGPEYFKELFRVSKNQIIWGGNNYILPPSRCFVIWDKGISPDFSMAMCEYVWTSFNGNAKIIKNIYADRNRTPSKEDRIHPTQKPVELYKWLLRYYAKPGDKILDTHVGSASSLIAFHQSEHDYIGFELDSDYYAAASERLENAMKQKCLFASENTQTLPMQRMLPNRRSVTEERS